MAAVPRTVKWPLVLAAACSAVGGSTAAPAPPPSALGPVSPLARVAAFRTAPPAIAGQIGSYIASEVGSQVPHLLLRGAPDLASAEALLDDPGIVAAFIPAANVTADTFLKAPAEGSPIGWLLLRYATVDTPAGVVPDDRLAHLVAPGPYRLTFLPLRVVTQNGAPQVQVLGRDAAAVETIAPAPAIATPAGLGMGPVPKTAGDRDVTVTLAGYTLTLHAGAQPDSAMLPRPEEGDLHVGDEAPDFTLKPAKGDSAVSLHDTRGKQPTVLIFGSYT